MMDPHQLEEWRQYKHDRLVVLLIKEYRSISALLPEGEMITQRSGTSTNLARKRGNLMK